MPGTLGPTVVMAGERAPIDEDPETLVGERYIRYQSFPDGTYEVTFDPVTRPGQEVRIEDAFASAMTVRAMSEVVRKRNALAEQALVEAINADPEARFDLEGVPVRRFIVCGKDEARSVHAISCYDNEGSEPYVGRELEAYFDEATEKAEIRILDDNPLAPRGGYLELPMDRLKSLRVNTKTVEEGNLNNAVDK